MDLTLTPVSSTGQAPALSLKGEGKSCAQMACGRRSCRKCQHYLVSSALGLTFARFVLLRG